MKNKDLSNWLIAQIIVAFLMLGFVGLIAIQVGKLQDAMVRVEDRLGEIHSYQLHIFSAQQDRFDDLSSQLLKSTTAIIQRCELPERKE